MPEEHRFESALTRQGDQRKADPVNQATEQPAPLTPSGIDRRSVLKKVAVGGAVAWAAPTVLSTRASAQEACTLKCAPVGGVVVSASVRVSPCGPGAPGTQPVNGVITSISATPDSCGCGGTPTVTTVDPAPGGQLQIRPSPGNEAAQFTVVVDITCLDRQGRNVTVRCSVTFTDVGDPGNCQARAGITYDYSAPAACGAPQCT
jgi:hypothetical protein